MIGQQYFTQNTDNTSCLACKAGVPRFPAPYQIPCYEEDGKLVLCFDPKTEYRATAIFQCREETYNRLKMLLVPGKIATITKTENGFSFT